MTPASNYSVRRKRWLPLNRWLLLLSYRFILVDPVDAIVFYLEGPGSGHSTISLTPFVYSQDGTYSYERVESVVMTADGNIVLSGYSNGNYARKQLEAEDAPIGAVAVKLDANGDELWRYQVQHATSYPSIVFYFASLHN